MHAQTKKNILIAVGIITVFTMLAAIAWIIYTASQFAEYQDPSYKFSVRYPVGWQVIKKPQPEVAVVFLSPKETALDIVQENINITVQSVPDEIASLKNFSKTIVQQMEGIFRTNIKIIENKSFNFGGRQGWCLVFEAPQPDHLKIVTAWTIRKGQAYILTFLTTIRQYPEYSFKIEEVLKSFQLK